MSGSVKRIGIAVVAALVGLTACTLAIDTSGLSSGEGDSTVDGGVADARTTDVVVPRDGGTDAPDIDATKPCGFCDGFDRAPEQLVDGWSFLLRQGGGLVDLDTSRGVTTQTSLHTVAPASNTNSVGASLVKDFVSTATKVELAFSVLVEDSISRHAHLAVIDFGKSPNQRYVFLLFVGGVLRLAEQKEEDNSFSQVGEVPLTPKSWHRFELSVTTGSSARTTLKVDGAVLQNDKALPYDLASPVSLSLGPNYAQNGARVEMWFDDVRLDLLP